MAHKRQFGLILLFACLLMVTTIWLGTTDVFVWHGILYLMNGSGDDVDVISCYDDNSSNLIQDISDYPPTKIGGIFFHETSCSSAYGSGDFVFSARQACAVESAAKANPDLEVTVLFLSPIRLSDIRESRNKAIHAILSYPNVQLKHVSIKKYLKGSPLEELYRGGALKRSQWPVSHASDIMRYATLWRHGGTYLDLDVVMLKSIEELKNFAGAESSLNLGAGIINLDHSSFGRDMANALVHELRTSFTGSKWGYNGPSLLTRVLSRICHAKKLEDMTSDHCGGFTVYPPSTFYPVSYMSWEDYFDESKSEYIISLHNESYAAHVWNKVSMDKKVRVGSQQPYGLLAGKNCPRVYATCDNVF